MNYAGSSILRVKVPMAKLIRLFDLLIFYRVEE